MSDTTAPGVKSILKAIDSGIKLGKRVARSSVYAPAAQVLQIADSAHNLQQSLAGSYKAITDAYKDCVAKCGEPFVDALLDEQENSMLKDLRIDLSDHIDVCQDFDENPLLFDPAAFDNLQKQGEKCCVQCVAIFHAVRERLLLAGLRKYSIEEDGRDDSGQLSSMRQNLEGSPREPAMRDVTTRKPVPSSSRQPTHISQLQITPPRAANSENRRPSNFEISTPLSAVSALAYSVGTSPRTMGPPLLSQNSRDAILPSPATSQGTGTSLIPWELVHSRLASNEEFLERRRQSRVLFHNEYRRSINSIEEDPASETFSDGVSSSPISGMAEMPGSIPSVAPFESHISRSDSGGYDRYDIMVSRQRSAGQGSQATRSSRASSIFPLTPPMSEAGTSSTADRWQVMTSTLEEPPIEGPPQYEGIEAGLEVVGFEVEPEQLTEKQRMAAQEQTQSDTGKEIDHDTAYDTGKETTFDTGMQPTFDTSEKIVDDGSGKMLANEAQSSPVQPTPAPSFISVDFSMRHDSSFYKLGGFCEGARSMMKGESGFKVVKRPSGHYSATVSARCMKCAYEVGWNDVEKDRLLDRSGIYGNNGIRWRQKFISKCHVKTASIEEPLYACVFCVEDQKLVEQHDATVFFSVSQLFRHLAKHPQPLPPVAGLTVLYGYQASDVLDFDLNFTTAEPKLAQWNTTEIATKIATRPTATATITHNPKNTARTARDPDGNESLHFAIGAKIVAITFPDKFLGQWCVGYHDGERGSIPASCLTLEMPTKEYIKMDTQSTLVATAKWDFKPKEGKEGGWLKFSKGDKITCVGYQHQDQWCWSGQTSKGKWGIFPASFAENLHESGKSVPASTSGLGFKSRMPSFSIGRNKSAKQGRQNSVRSVGSSSSATSANPGNVAVYGQPGLEVARPTIGTRRG